MTRFIALLLLIASVAYGQTVSRTVQFKDNATTEDGFDIRRCTPNPCTPTTVLFHLGANAGSGNNVSYVDNSSPQAGACYDVRATLAGSGDSAFSSVACSSTLQAPGTPGAPGIINP